jgi:hypothetical protein
VAFVDDMGDPGCDGPEEAARGDIPPQFAQALGTEIHGTSAKVWLLTNGPQDFEAITAYCDLKDGRWYSSGHLAGFRSDTPPEVRQRARELGWR